MIAGEPMRDSDGDVVSCSCGLPLEAGSGLRTILDELPPYPWGMCLGCGLVWGVIEQDGGCLVVQADPERAS